MPLFNKLLLVSLFIVSASCSWISPKIIPQTLPLSMPLLPARHIVQRIRADWPEQSSTFLCILELSPKHIAMAGLTEEGLSLFNLQYDGKILQLEKSPLLPENIDPQFIVSDLQLSYWPLAELQNKLTMDWRLEAPPNRRLLYRGNELLAEVIYTASKNSWPQTVQLINYLYHYRLHIATVSYETLSQ